MLFEDLFTRTGSWLNNFCTPNLLAARCSSDLPVPKLYKLPHTCLLPQITHADTVSSALTTLSHFSICASAMADMTLFLLSSTKVT
jgi:hypothetical protein